MYLVRGTVSAQVLEDIPGGTEELKKDIIMLIPFSGTEISTIFVIQS